ncbi:exportin-6-B isoform X3 [Schistocerca nitens]|uniref:exportin-6-B isoform X3 n=1 Tax=Schistocerca nitens TaxID=7011 RepID=UPI0021192D84|nr:exportin-6-B isoform X3 [Schistocerca nitens]
MHIGAFKILICKIIKAVTPSLCLRDGRKRPIGTIRPPYHPQATESQSLAALEALMNEFFAPETSNDRKREIETVLHDFSNQQGAWKHCIYFMSHSSNQYVCMYSLNTIEKLITKQWLGLMWDERAQIKSMLYQFALEHHNTVPNFIRNKLVKLVVDIARLDWPHFYPDFFTNILQLIQNPETTVLGLVFLQTASEELVCPWEDLSISRKEELRRLLLAHIPQVFSILTNLFEQIAQKQQQHGVTATPPPSPTHGQPNSTSPVHSGSLLSSVLGNGRKFHSCLDTDSDTICCLALQALTHLLSWVPISSYITPNLVASLFQLASITQASSAHEGHSVGMLAMAAINEIMYKNCIPVSCEDFLLGVFQQAMHLMNNILQSGGLEHLEESYQEKITEFLRVFVGLHLRRLENNQKFSLLDFLSMLFKYTFQQSSLEHFTNCLEVWNILLGQLDTGTEMLTTTFHAALLSLVEQILRKIQFKFNQCELEELDDKTLDDDEQTEWQKFLRQNIEIVAKVGEFAPLDTYSLVYEPWKEAANIYLHLEQAVDVSKHQLSVTAEHECVRLHCLLRDLSSLTQLMGRMYPHFIGKVLRTLFPDAQQLVLQLTGMATYASRVQLHHLHTSPPILTEDLVEVHSQVLAALKAWCHWIAQLRSEGSMRAVYEQVMVDIIQSVYPLLTKAGEPERLCHSAAHLLLSFTNVVRPLRLWEADAIREMYQIVPRMNYLQPETKRLVTRALCNTLLLSCPGVPNNEQCWDERHRLLTDLMDSLTACFQHVTPTSPHAQDANVHKALSLFPAYVRTPNVCEAILEFFMKAFAGLQQQLGASLTETTVQTFLDVFTREQLSTSMGQEGGAGARVVEKFLQLLQLVIAEPAASFKRFVPSTITLCLEHVYPLVAESPSPEIKPALFGLLHAVMMHKWQYFYNTPLLQALNQNAGSEHIDNREQLISILRAYGQSLLQPDINIFGQNLKSLEQINIKWKLYHRSIFQEELLGQFLTVLFHSLIHKSHALLEEEITTAMYNMASVNFTAFYSEYLPRFLQSTEGLDNDQKEILQRNFRQEVDLPSFTQNVQRLVNDLRCYRLCNSSLPGGSVKL